MRAFAFALLFGLAPTAPLHANATPTAVFLGCVQSSANCVSGQAAFVGPAGFENFQTWQYSLVTTFDPSGGWVFSYQFTGHLGDEIFAFSVDPYNEVYGGGLGLGSPNATSIFSGFLAMPAGWTPERLDVFTYEPGRDPPGAAATGFQTTGLFLPAQAPTTPIPEPTTLALVGAGLAAVATRRRRNSAWLARRGPRSLK